MELKSEPGFVDEQVTDIDVWFASGRYKELTLGPNDTYIDAPAGIDVEIAQPKESMSLNKAHIEAYSIRSRVQRRPIKAGPPITQYLDLNVDAPPLHRSAD